MRHASFCDVVGLLLKGRLPDAGERRLIDTILIAIADHGAGAPSAVAARVVATGNRQAPEAAIAAGILAIGDAHGGAGLACFGLIQEWLDRAQRDEIAIDELARLVVEEAQRTKRRLPGFGHRMYREDPRAVALLRLADDLGKAREGVRLVRAVETAFSSSNKPVPLNVDGAIAGVLFDLEYPALAAKLIFIIGRTAGLSAHVIEEYKPRTRDAHPNPGDLRRASIAYCRVISLRPVPFHRLADHRTCHTSSQSDLLYRHYNVH